MIASVISLCGNGVPSSASVLSILYLCKSVFICSCRTSASLHLPVFDELVRNFFQKTRWPLENVAVASTQSHLRKGEIKFIARAGDRHIKQTPLLLERIASVERATARKHAVSQPNNEHGIKFEPVFELARKHGKLIQIFTAQFVIGEIDLCVVIVNRFDNRCDHFRRRIGLPARSDLIERMRELLPRFF